MVARINRALPGHERLHILHGRRWESDLGRYHVIDHRQNTIVVSHCDLGALAAGLG